MANDDPYSLRRKEQRAFKNADQAESVAITFGTASIDAGTYDERIAGAMDDYDPTPDRPVEGVESAVDTDVKYESISGETREKIELRIDLFGDTYPFTLRGGSLVYTPSKSGFYEFCLATSLAPHIERSPNTILPRTFERVVTQLVCSYLGSDAKCLHVGTPRDEQVGHRFHEAMKVLEDQTAEWKWGPSSELPQTPDSQGDEGVDFIVWKPTGDNRKGSLFILGQCACGDNWDGKFGDVDLVRYNKWFNPPALAQPVRAFATPFHVSEGNLSEALRQGGLVFDRARLCYLAEPLAAHTSYLPFTSRMERGTKLIIPEYTAPSREVES